jgi:energy-coupling factor transport system permease protein
MVLRFIPRLDEQAHRISEAQQGYYVPEENDISLNYDVKKDEKEASSNCDASLMERIRAGIDRTSILATWALENSIETADSMRSRGYGISEKRSIDHEIGESSDSSDDSENRSRSASVSRTVRTNYSGFVMRPKDVIMTCCIILISGLVIWGKLAGALYFAAYPVIIVSKVSGWTIGLLAAYAGLCFMPAGLKLTEDLRWNHSLQKVNAKK